MKPELVIKLLKSGKACFILYDHKEEIFVLFPANGLHRRKGF
jgi:hypothetical protein